MDFECGSSISLIDGFLQVNWPRPLYHLSVALPLSFKGGAGLINSRGPGPAISSKARSARLLVVHSFLHPFPGKVSIA